MKTAKEVFATLTYTWNGLSPLGKLGVVGVAVVVTMLVANWIS